MGSLATAGRGIRAVISERTLQYVYALNRALVPRLSCQRECNVERRSKAPPGVHQNLPRKSMPAHSRGSWRLRDSSSSFSAIGPN